MNDQRVNADGVLIVDKPRGPTSHDIVAQARRVLGTRAVGHAGTLDPMASGVLVLLVGEATKLATYLTLDEKEYRATVELGRSTDTCDAEGTTTEERSLPDGFPAPGDLEAALASECARTEQVPPAFSAVSVGGQRAHRLARRGETVSLPPRPVTVTKLSLLECRQASPAGRACITLNLRVSKGYYVRSFARDLGARLGVPAHLTSLQRTASGPYRVEAALRWPPDGIPELVPLETAACTALPSATLTATGETLARRGSTLTEAHFESPPPRTPAAWLSAGRRLIAIGHWAEEGYRVLRGFRGTFPQEKAP
jgi:tRNA pseudouridine55 synthase